MSHSKPIYSVGQPVIYKKNGQAMTIVSWTFDHKPGGPLYTCSDGFQHREWNLEPVTQEQAEQLAQALQDAAQLKPPPSEIAVEPTPEVIKTAEELILEQEEAQKAAEEKQKKLDEIKSTPDNKEQAIEKWHINPELDLVQQAADFYITNEAAADFPILKPHADERAEFLAYQFSQYLAMAIGGELRHTRTRDYASWVSQPVLEVLKEIGNDRHLYFHLSRNQAWYRWADIYQKKNLKKRTALIRTARRIFRRGRWRRAYGGNNWSLIALTLYNYLKNDLTPTAFVDTVFGLYHNCNLVLDKVWAVQDLRRTLDENFKHDMTALYQKCSQDTKGVVSLYRRFKHYGEG